MEPLKLMWNSLYRSPHALVNLRSMANPLGEEVTKLKRGGSGKKVCTLTLALVKYNLKDIIIN